MILGVALSVGGLWLARYQPLSLTSSWVDRRFAVDRGNFVAPEGGQFEAFDVNARTGDLVRFAFALQNEGPVGVTVQSIGTIGAGSPLRLISVRVQRPGTEAVVAPKDPSFSEPFRPFSLPPHQERWIVFAERDSLCRVTPGSSATYLGTPVVFRALGLTRHVFLPLPFTLRVPDGIPCP